MWKTARFWKISSSNGNGCASSGTSNSNSGKGRVGSTVCAHVVCNGGGEERVRPDMGGGDGERDEVVAMVARIW